MKNLSASLTARRDELGPDHKSCEKDLHLFARPIPSFADASLGVRTRPVVYPTLGNTIGDRAVIQIKLSTAAMCREIKKQIVEFK
jgi:hypothetical protein